MPVIAVHFLGERAAFVGAEENVALVDENGEISTSPSMAAASCASASDGARIVMGGDDGKLVALDKKGEIACSRPIRSGAGSTMSRCIPMARWRGRPARRLSSARQGRGKIARGAIDSRRAGLRAEGPAAGDRALQRRDPVVSEHGRQRRSAGVGGFASRRRVQSPDNKFLVTSMHEPALHGWRLADHRHMRMTGYPGRVRSMSWSAGGKALATSGADSVIMWPFASKDGPMGKEPAMLAPLQARVTVVACHPKQDILAAGYSDGTILMVRMMTAPRSWYAGMATAPSPDWAGIQRLAACVHRRSWRRGIAGVVRASAVPLNGSIREPPA